MVFCDVTYSSVANNLPPAYYRLFARGLFSVAKITSQKDNFLVVYDVDPSDVRHQRGSFAKAFETHDKKFISTQCRDKVKQWKADLTKVANLSGWPLENYKCERELIEDIVKCVRRKVQTTFQLFDSPDKFVERDSALIRMSELLDLGANDVRFIGITGMGGIGKTTLAHRVCDIISQHFDVNCVLEKVREVSAKDFTLLQNQLLFSIFKDKDVEFWDARRRDIFIREGLRNNKVLLVLDDVDHLDQLQKLAADKDWFRNGSRIVITTRDRRLLVQHDITLLYEVEGMSDGEALALFSLKAFKKVQPDEEFLELSEHFVNHANGVPLVLKVWGSFLYQRDRDAWDSGFINLQKIPHRDVFDSLKISYDGLPEEEKSIFLDIACFHKGKHKQQVIGILDRRFDNISSRIVIDILIERSLLTMTHHMHLEMHDLIQDMGREIVLRESKEEPGKRTRIWHLDDLCHVLTFNTGTEKVEAIVVNSRKLEEIRCDSNGFSNMHGLRHIELHNVKIMIIASAPIYPSAPIGLPHFLRIIHWSWYPFMSLPQSFHAPYLTQLSMPNSKLVRLWDGRKDFPNLKFMNFSDSDKLISTPDFTGMPNLVFLIFSWCPNLVDIHSSIAVLKKLKRLDLRFCKSMECLHSELEMDSLFSLNMGNCSKLRKVPEFSEQMKTLSQLHLECTAIEQLPSSIANLVGLTYLNLGGTAIKQLPSSIGNLVGLTYLNLGGTTIEQLPSSIGNLVGLDHLELRGTAIKQLPSSIGNLVRLGHLDLGGTAIEQRPSSIRNLVGLTYLQLRGTAIKQLPSSIGNLVSLNHVELSGTAIEQLPSSIGNLVNLIILNLSKSAIEQLPSSIGNLVNLIYLNLSTSAIEQLPSSIGNLVNLTFLFLNGTAIEELPSSIGNPIGRTILNLAGCKRLCVAGWPLNQALNHLRCLENLDLSGCNLGEGALPEDIGCLSSLRWLDLAGNHFVTLPASIQCLSMLNYLRLDRCEMLQDLPPLPSTSHGDLYVHVENCTSLRRLTDPSKLTSNFANLYDFELFPLNCVRLVEDESFINYVHFKIFRWITNGITHTEQDMRRPRAHGRNQFTYPASEIPEWFVNKSEEAGDWLGIAFCFVWANEFPDGTYMDVIIEWSSGLFDPLKTCLRGDLGPEHVTMFYLPREICRKECPEAGEAEFSVRTEYYDEASKSWKVGSVNMVKWAARWVYKQDLVDLQQRFKVRKRTHDYYGEEADSSGSDAISDDEEPNRKRLKVLKRTHEDYGEEANPSGSDAISDDEEPNCKRQKEDPAALDIGSE